MDNNTEPETSASYSKQGADLVALPDPAQLALLAKRDGIGPDDEALHEAQNIIYDAWEERDGRRRNALTRKALRVSPFCADAWMILASRPSLSTHDRRCFLERALVAGELALGEGGLKRYKGSFWGMLETRPYMRARHALAEELWHAGEHDAAIAHLHDMLKLNSGDNQGIRYVLLAWLVTQGDDAGSEALLRKHGDGSAIMRYTAALLAFRKTGDSDVARRAAIAAFKCNVHVPRLLGDRGFRFVDTGYYSPGREDEAGFYVEQYGAAWRAQSGAVRWLSEVAQEIGA